MPKFYRRKFYRPKVKYSVEQSVVQLTVASGVTSYQTVVPPVTIQGMRKVKHLTLSLQAPSDGSDGALWALVYVPQGTTPGNLSGTTGDPLYEPNQYVMNCGVMDFSAGPCRISSAISRNLNSGDQIVLLIRPTPDTKNLIVTGTVRYAVTLN